LLVGPRAARAQADSAVETGALQLFKFKQPIGEERYRITRDSSGLALTTAFEFTDRFRRVSLTASLEAGPDLAPRHFATKGMTSRWTTTDVEVDVGDTLARHRELELYVASGFTPMEAIQAATIVPARVMHLDREVGTVAAGKRADLLIVDGDPLRRITDLRRVRLVVANGRRYDPAPLWRSVGFTP
jgi:hypothetical protein